MICCHVNIPQGHATLESNRPRNPHVVPEDRVDQLVAYAKLALGEESLFITGFDADTGAFRASFVGLQYYSDIPCAIIVINRPTWRVSACIAA